MMNKNIDIINKDSPAAVYGSRTLTIYNIEFNISSIVINIYSTYLCIAVGDRKIAIRDIASNKGLC